jgi:(R,R)-butanediol dehydrogenase / meso-butanediol dehydrogenase / diacetyl reductase
MAEKKMLGAVFEGNGKLTLKEMPVPVVTQPDDVVVKVDACGICGSDVAILAVPPAHPAVLNSVLGHEFVGHVTAVGRAVSHVKPGDRVAIAPNLSCGVCPYCRLGMTNQCLSWTALGVHRNGGFAEYNLAPASAVLPLDPKLPLDEAVFIEPLSCVYAGTSKLNIQPGETAVVLGAGPIGLIFIKVLKASGAGKIIASDVMPFRLECAKQAGADVVVNSKEQDLEDLVRAETGLGAQVVVDAVGSLANQATHIAAKKARICLFGVNSNAKPALEQWMVTHNELALFGTFVGVAMFPPAIRMLESGVVSLSSLLSHRLALADIHKGFEAIHAGQAIKVMILP